MKITSQKKKDDKQLSSTGRRQRIWGLAVCIMLGISLFCRRESLGDIYREIRKNAGPTLCVSAMLALTAYALEGATIDIMSRMVHRETCSSCIKRRNGIKIAFLCEFYRMVTLGSGSGIAEIHYMHENGIEPGDATALTMIQYMCKRIAVLLLGSMGFILLYGGDNTGSLCGEYAVFMGIGCLLSVAVIAVFLCVVLSARIASGVSWLLERLAIKLPSRKQTVDGWKEQVLLLNSCGKDILRRKKQIVWVLLSQLGKLLLFYSIPMCFLCGYTGLRVTEGICLMAVVYMLSGIIPTPSGAGSLEVVFVLFSAPITGSDLALSAILLFRFVTWILPFAVGGLLLLAERVIPKTAL